MLWPNTLKHTKLRIPLRKWSYPRMAVIALQAYKTNHIYLAVLSTMDPGTFHRVICWVTYIELCLKPRELGLEEHLHVTLKNGLIKWCWVAQRLQLIKKQTVFLMNLKTVDGLKLSLQPQPYICQKSVELKI